MIVLHAASLDQIEPDDVKRAALNLGVLPANIARPKPKPVPESEPLPGETTESAPSGPEPEAVSGAASGESAGQAVPPVVPTSDS
jgi:hypothetical protein